MIGALSWAAAEGPLPLCQSLLRQREVDINIDPVSYEAIQDLLHCNGELAELYNPSIVLEPGVSLSDFDCRLHQVGCLTYDGLAWRYLSYFADVETYITQVTDRLKEGELERLEQYTHQFPNVLPEGNSRGGAAGLIEASYNRFNDENGWWPDGYDGLKVIVEDLTYHYIQSEMIGFGFDPSDPRDREVMEREARRYQSGLRSCFSKAHRIQGVDTCIDLMKTYGSFGLGHFVLTKTIETEFGPQVAESQQSEFLQSVDGEFHRCLPTFFFNPEEDIPNFKKIQACVFHSLLQAFQWVLQQAIAESLRIPPDSGQLNQVLQTSMAECEVAPLLRGSQESLQTYRLLTEWEAEEFEAKLLQCQTQVQNNLVYRVVENSLAREALLVEFYGDRLHEFSRSIVEEHFPVCMERLMAVGRGGSPQLCENFLFSATVFQYFSDLIEREIQVKWADLFDEVPLSPELQESILQQAQDSMRECQVQIQTAAINHPDQSRESMEAVLSGCLSQAILSLSAALVQRLVPIELEFNPLIAQYNVSLGSNQLRRLTRDFSNCLAGELQTLERLVDMQTVIERGQQSCQLQVYRPAILLVLDQILESELASAGLPVEVFMTLISEYRESPSSLYADIRQATSQEELDQLTEGADQRVLSDLAPLLIDRMIEEEAGEFLGPRAQARIVNLVTERFLGCVTDASITACEQVIRPLAIEAILYNVLPREVEREFEEASIHHITLEVIARLGVRQLVRDSFDQPVGRTLIDFIVSEMLQGRGVEEISRDFSFRQNIFQIFATDGVFMAALLEAIVQPQMDAERARLENRSPLHWLGVNVFVHREIFQWRNIKNTPSGREVQRRFVAIFARLITRPDQAIRSEEMGELAELVQQAARERNRELNGQQNRQGRDN